MSGPANKAFASPNFAFLMQYDEVLVRHAALGQPLLPHSQRVQAALQRILATRPWTEPQRRWLERIGKQLEQEVVVDREAIDSGQFKVMGGYQRLNTIFGGQLDNILGDTLSPTGARLPKADVILTNPPFGTKRGGGRPTRDDFTHVSGNKQLAFLQHVYRGLKPGGRAAIVVPDNVLFEEGTGTKVRADLMDKCNLHTILRLPTGIFYAQGVKTNVLFFTRGVTDTGNTKQVWVYDLRTNMPAFGKRTPLTHEHFADFEKCYGSKSDGTGERIDQGEAGRFRCSTREAIAKRADNLDISWLKDDEAHSADDLPEPDEIAALIRDRLQTAMEEMDALTALLEGEEVEA